MVNWRWIGFSYWRGGILQNYFTMGRKYLISFSLRRRAFAQGSSFPWKMTNGFLGNIVDPEVRLIWLCGYWATIFWDQHRPSPIPLGQQLLVLWSKLVAVACFGDSFQWTIMLNFLLAQYYWYGVMSIWAILFPLSTQCMTYS